jgi:hypothetical protein
MLFMRHIRPRFAAVTMFLLFLGGAVLAQYRLRESEDMPPALASNAEFYFVRVEYSDFFGSGRRFGRGYGGGFGRGWWMQDMPAAERHFQSGVRRLTRIDIGEARHTPLTDDRLYNYPWIYATQVGYWDLSDAETERLREYFMRGGFMIVDDFWGPSEWEVFRESMQRVFPGRPIVDIGPTDAMMHVLYSIDERTQIPGLRHLRIGPGGATFAPLDATPPHWRAIYDDQGRMLVTVFYNMDVGDAWECADMPEYPEASTSLAYRLAINSIVYSMTH